MTPRLRHRRWSTGSNRSYGDRGRAEYRGAVRGGARRVVAGRILIGCVPFSPRRADHRIFRAAGLAAGRRNRWPGWRGAAGPRALPRSVFLAGLATDEPCRNACAVAFGRRGVPEAPVDAVAVDGTTGAVDRDLGRCWYHPSLCRSNAAGAALTAARAICAARTSALTPRRSMTSSPLGPWDTIAIGDGGNEIGMGALPQGLIARHVEHGETIECVTPARQLIVAGVSHWGAYCPDRCARRDSRGLAGQRYCAVSMRLDRKILEVMLREGPAVDGGLAAAGANDRQFRLSLSSRQITAACAGSPRTNDF